VCVFVLEFERVTLFYKIKLNEHMTLTLNSWKVPSLEFVSIVRRRSRSSMYKFGIIGIVFKIPNGEISWGIPFC